MVTVNGLARRPAVSLAVALAIRSLFVLVPAEPEFDRIQPCPAMSLLWPVADLLGALRIGQPKLRRE